MSFLVANCPSCAAQIEFKSGSSIVIICPFCRSAVARTDRKLEDLGKIAEIVQTPTPLKVGLKGVWNNTRFELTGRAQLKHAMGGYWDEWYATFSNGWVGWLAEAQGKFYLTFYQPLPEGTQLPSYDQLMVGAAVPQISNKIPLLVAEKSTASYAAAEGDIPYKLVPNEQVWFADLSGAGGAFATIDYGMTPPMVFMGSEVTLEQLGLAAAKMAERKAPRVAASRMNCPNCAAPLELRAPDKTERVTCSYCNSLLDVNQGNLTFLKALAPQTGDQFVLNIGQIGVFADGLEMTIIGAVVRSVNIEGITYYWHEYLLYKPQIGFRWLIHSDNHWNFVEPVNVADVAISDTTMLGLGSSDTRASYNNQKFKIFQDAQARVEYVKGEFYWRVEQGESVWATDYIAAPMMLSRERTNNEVNWSLGKYMTNQEIEKAFGVENLPRPWSVAPNQPFTGGFYIKWGFLLLGALLALSIFMVPFMGFQRTVTTQNLVLRPTGNENTPQIIFSEQFDLRGNQNVQISASAPVSNSWANLDIDLIEGESNEIDSVTIPIEFYSGTEDGESWSEGGQNGDATMSSLPAGKYKLRVEGTWQNAAQPLPVQIKVEQNVTRGVNFCCAFFILAIMPLVSLIRWWLFESRRWSESMYTSGGVLKSTIDYGSSDDE